MSVQQGPLDLNLMKGTVGVVTGCGNGGIGWGLAKRCAEMGMDVALVDLHDHIIQAATKELAALYPSVNCIGVAADVSKMESMERCAASITAGLPNKPIGAVFANAGVNFINTIEKGTLEEWQTTMNVNVLGAVISIKAFLPILKKQKSQSVFCITSSTGGLYRVDAGAASYQSSKMAVVGIAEGLSMELARTSPQIRVHCLCPCLVKTAFNVNSKRNLDTITGKRTAEEEAQVKKAGDQSTLDDNSWFLMTVEQHARQTWDRIEKGQFYVITQNIRPYVDHDFVFDGMDLIQSRFENILQMKLDNADAFSATRSAVFKGALFDEVNRRAKAKAKL